MEVVTVDFETFAIQGRPHYPPMPVGVSIQYQGKRPKYYAFGHTTKNNCSWDQAKKALERAWKHEILCHNAKFDLDVAETFFGLPVPPPERLHDTMYLLFLDDPHAQDLGLKAAADRLLHMPPDEQDKLRDWLLEHKPVKGITPKRFGAHIAHAPGDLVGKYANGDTARTTALFELLLPKIERAGMMEAYDRERRLLPVLLEMERRGVPVDLQRLEKDVEQYSAVWEQVDAQILEIVGDINIDSGMQLMQALIDRGMVVEAELPRTPPSKTKPDGQIKSDQATLLAHLKDETLLPLLQYRGKLKKSLSTYMRPWLETAQQSGGRIFTNWNSIRGSAGGGARTGRFSSTPNFQNIPNPFGTELDGYPALPRIRGYITAFPEHTLVGADFASQELRVLAHFENGAMLTEYQRNPDTDFHQVAADMLSKQFGRQVPRKITKNIAFSVLYGTGIDLLAQTAGLSVGDARAFKYAYLDLFPGIRRLQDGLKQRAKLGRPFRTVGGRNYHCEPPKMVNGELRDFAYKSLNYCIQGSSADLTKQAMIDYNRMKVHGHLMLTIHDEIIISVAEQHAHTEAAILRKAMTETAIDTPMLTDTEIGLTWDTMVELENSNDKIMVV